MRIMAGLIITVMILVAGVTGCAYAEDPLTPVPPAAPTGLTVAGIEDNRANVAWAPVADADQYTVWVDGNRWTATKSAGTVLTGLQPYTEYMIYVTASNANGESEPSSTVTFTTLPPVPTAPRAYVKSVGHSEAVIEWATLPSWQYIQTYRVYVDGQAVADVEAHSGIHEATLQNLSEGTHRVSVAGVNANREGAQSEAVTVTISAVVPPSSPVLANRGSDRVLLTWQASPDAVKYKVTIDGVMSAETRTTEIQLEGLEPDQTYDVNIAAVNADGLESLPATIEVTTASAWPETSVSNVMNAVYGYVPDIMPGLIVLFAVGAAVKVARAGKYALGARRI